MAEIKTKDKVNAGGGSSAGSIRQLDRVKLLKDRTKDNIIRTKDGIVKVDMYSERLQSDSENETTYAQDRVVEGMQDTGQEAASRMQQGARKAKDKAKEKIEKRIENRLKERREQDRIRQKPEEPVNEAADGTVQSAPDNTAVNGNAGRNITAENSNSGYGNTSGRSSLAIQVISWELQLSA